MSQEPSRVLITRLSALGDCVHTLPLACALKSAYPAVHISWVAEEHVVPLLLKHDFIDEVFSLPRHWAKSPARILDLRRKLRKRRFDAVIDPQSLSKSAVIAFLSGAPLRIGFSGRFGREISTVLNNSLIEPRRQHAIDRYLELLAPFGIHNPGIRFGVPRLELPSKKLDDFLAKELPAANFVVVAPGASWPSKKWPTERYAQIVEFLSREFGLSSVVIWGSQLERQEATRIASLAARKAVVAPPFDLLELAELLRRTALFIGSDSGPLHLAAAVDTRVIGIYGPTRPTQTGPYGTGHVALQEFYQRGPKRYRRRASNSAMRAVTVERVSDACREILKGDRQAQHVA